jgi:hypothetical protein
MSGLVIEPFNLHWLKDIDPAADLCAHGGVRVALNGRMLLQTDGDDYAVSTAALNLLRTLDADHRSGEPDRLVPHCGHAMFVDPDSGEVVKMGGVTGVDWSVAHSQLEQGATATTLTFINCDAEVLPFAEWRAAVVAFPQAVRDFYFATPKRPESSEDSEWFEAFHREWGRRHAHHSRAAP